jgi:hypothetical protein
MEHVYVRVSWLNRPKDLKGGRQDHHSKHELVPTDQMDVVNTQVVSGTFEPIRSHHLKDDNWKNAPGKVRRVNTSGSKPIASQLRACW